MKVLVTGANGQLGYDVVRELESRKIECLGVSRAEFDLTDFAAVRSFVEGWAPDIVIHCAAYTAVDQAESEPELCQQVNAAATRNIAEICRDIKTEFVAFFHQLYAFGPAFNHPVQWKTDGFTAFD